MANHFARVTGGVETICFGLIDALREAGHEVRLLSTQSPDNTELAGEFVPLTVSHAEREELGPRGRARAARAAFWNREAADAARRLIEGWRPDLLHAHKLYPQLSVAPVVVAAASGVPVVQSIYDYEFLSASPIDHRGRALDRDETKATYRLLNSALLQVRRRRHVPRIDEWISISAYLARLHSAAGIETTTVPLARAPRGNGSVPGFEGREGIVLLARLTEEKGVRDAIELSRRLPGLPLTIVGAGPLAPEVAAAAAEIENLRFEGWAEPDRVDAILARARVAIMPARWQEPAGIVALEAAAAGTPLVSYSAGGLSEYAAAVGGTVVEPGVQGLADACAAICEDAGRWRRLSDAGRVAIEAEHSPQRQAERVLDVYERARMRGGASS